MTKARNLKFGVRIDFDECYLKHANIEYKRGVAQVTWLTFKFWDLHNISGAAKANNLKCGVHIDYYEYYSKHAKLRDKRGVA